MITTPLQSLRVDTLNIALSYGIRPIASGSFIIDIFLDTKRPHQRPFMRTTNIKICVKKGIVSMKVNGENIKLKVFEES